MSTEELVSGVLEGLKLNALDLSALVPHCPAHSGGVVVIRVLLRIVDRMLSRSQNLGSWGAIPALWCGSPCGSSWSWWWRTPLASRWPP